MCWYCALPGLLSEAYAYGATAADICGCAWNTAAGCRWAGSGWLWWACPPWCVPLSTGPALELLWCAGGGIVLHKNTQNH